jgi:hypothetical protein
MPCANMHTTHKSHVVCCTSAHSKGGDNDVAGPPGHCARRQLQPCAQITAQHRGVGIVSTHIYDRTHRGWIVGVARAVVFSVHDEISARNTVYTPYAHGSGQP